jgi:hypothetical protein
MIGLWECKRGESRPMSLLRFHKPKFQEICTTKLISELQRLPKPSKPFYMTQLTSHKLRICIIRIIDCMSSMLKLLECCKMFNKKTKAKTLFSLIKVHSTQLQADRHTTSEFFISMTNNTMFTMLKKLVNVFSIIWTEQWLRKSLESLFEVSLTSKGELFSEVSILPLT